MQTDPTLLCYASAVMEKKECWELLTQKYDRFQTFLQQLPTTCKRVCNQIQGTYSGSNVIALVLLTFIGNVKKRQHLKICLLKCDKIWQKSCSYQTSVNEGLKTKVEQTSFVAYQGSQ